MSDQSYRNNFGKLSILVFINIVFISVFISITHHAFAKSFIPKSGSDFDFVKYSLINAEPSSIPADNFSISTITVIVMDMLEQPLPGRSVRPQASREFNGSVFPPKAISDSNGMVTFAVKSPTISDIVFTAIDETNQNEEILQSVTVNFFEVNSPCLGQPGSIVSWWDGSSVDGPTAIDRIFSSSHHGELGNAVTMSLAMIPEVV